MLDFLLHTQVPLKYTCVLLSLRTRTHTYIEFICKHTHTHTHTHTHVVKGHIRKGHALLAQKDTVKAMQAFQNALEIDPKNAVSC
jgi:Tfp pilus assembly protein PilF